MAASPNLSQFSKDGKSHIGKTGVLTLAGFGIKVCMQSGHLEIEDGIGPDRRKIRLARVGHGLKRLVLIGSDGFVTLAALRWLADQDVAFAMLNRDGRVLAVTGPVSRSDSRLRRAQAMAIQSGAALRIARGLIADKLLGQERVARQTLLATNVADEIRLYSLALEDADTFERIRSLESKAASSYWAKWRHLAVHFPKKEESRVPKHWRSFGTRVSPLTGSPRLAVNPANAILNYLYAVLESESRLAAAALGLDPGIGMLHVDTPARDSLACDLMEAVRPHVDAYVLDLLLAGTVSRGWFFEESDGNCRLMADFTARLSQTALSWGRAIAPFAERVAQELWNSKHKPIREQVLPTLLTQRRRSESRGNNFVLKPVPASRPQRICRGCGAATGRGKHCPTCGREVSRVKLIELAKAGRIAAQKPESRAKHSEMGNPVEDERDSGLKPNTIPL